MFLGEVVGNVWTTQKEAGMENLKLLIVKPLNSGSGDGGHMVVAVDRIGAGVGEQVIVTRGTPAQKIGGDKNIPIDAAIVGIVDSLEVLEQYEYLRAKGANKN